MGHWECDLWYYFRNDSGSLDSTLTISLQTSNEYLFFPPKVYQDGPGLYQMNLRVFNTEGDLTGTHNKVSPYKIPIDPDDIGIPQGWDLGDLVCEYVCNGRTTSGWYFPYAWAIKIYEVQGSKYYYSVRQAYIEDSTGTREPYYAYYPASNFHTWYNASACSCTNEILGPLSAGNYRDLNGGIITEAVIAVEKDAGPWGQQGGMRSPAPVAPPQSQQHWQLGSSPCNNGIDFFMDALNLNGGFASTPTIPAGSLVCHRAFDQPGSLGGGLPHTWTLKWLEDRVSDLLSLYIWWADTTDSSGGGIIIPPIADPMDNLWQVLSELEDESEIGLLGHSEENESGPRGVDPNIGDIIDRLLIKDMLGEGGTTVIDLQNLYDPEGHLLAPSEILPPGLYKLAIGFKDGSLITRVVEANTGLDFSYEQADLVSIQDAPNPITNNTFSIIIEPGYTGEVFYELIDHMGIKHHSVSLDFERDQISTYPIDLQERSIPAGIYYHTFHFPDGSSKSIPTMIGI